MRLTDGQKAAVEHRGANLLLAASAGTGKTEVLARHCASLVADPQHPGRIDRMLVVTFTRAAASELRTRVARMLRDEAERAPSVELRRHLRQQQMLVDAADIGTIDSWCGRIVREHFGDAGVDVEFRVLGGEDGRLLRREVLDELFEQIHRGDDPLAVEARAWIARAPSPRDDFLRLLVKQLSAFREHLVNPDAWFAAACDAPHAEQILAAALQEECRFQHEQLSALIRSASSTAVEGALTLYCDRLAEWDQLLADAACVLQVVDEIASFKMPKRARAEEPPDITEVRKRWLGKRLQEAWSPADIQSILTREPDTARLLATLLRLENRYHKLLNEAKQRQAAYEFGDVLRMTLDLLGEPGDQRERTPTPIARRLQQRYEHVLVDEYQDTSPVQVEILRLVTRDGEGRANRFMVGDVKQSIYGFRQAEPRLFAALRETYAAGRADGIVRYLSDNFRSHHDLLAVLNDVFALLFDDALGGTPYGVDERLSARRAETPNPSMAQLPRVAVHIVEQERGNTHASDDDDEVVGAERIEQEAQLAAEEILAMLRAGVQVPARQPDGTVALRPLGPADIVVLLRSAKQNAGLVAQVLRANGIACATSGREALLESVEAQDVCCVLALLVNRRRDVELAAYLRGPLVGLTARELLCIRTEAPRSAADFYDAVEEYRSCRTTESVATKLDAAMTQLDRWVMAMREEDLPALLRRVLEESGLPSLVQALPGGEQRVAFLRSLQNLARTFSEGGQGSVPEFIEYLDSLATEQIDPGALAAAEQDVVRVMTIHGAKGLEYPVVFLLGAGSRFNTQRQKDTLQCDEDLGVGLRFGDYRACADLVHARHHVIRRRVAHRELEEELRLLYVATTRARERLIIVGHTAAGLWEACRTQYANREGPPPLISRLSVPCQLEWVLQAVAAGRLHEATNATASVDVMLHEADAIVVTRQKPRRNVDPPTEPLSPEDDAWVARAGELITADVDRRLAELPAVLSVSAAKELALREQTADQPPTLDRVGPRLAGPAFAAQGSAPDGAVLGTACHRFLELADLTRLNTERDVRSQMEQLVDAGSLSPAQHALVPVADVVWLGTSDVGRLLSSHAGAVRREVPFVYALPLGDEREHAIVRGVIDCLLPTPAGWAVMDYKTDNPRDESDLETRLSGYRVQVQLYAQAASAIFGQPVTRALLVMLRARRMVEVDPSGPSLGCLVETLGGAGVT